jgi:formate hydrogenlyase transcriptional activator
LQKVFDLISNVARSDSTVLLLGETGTGKELIARAIHNDSSRRDKLMVKVNCAAIPASLVESELFGHERGSFTGATERRIGKFELANHSTLFLDEIGEMALDMQVKLLRAIQEKEIERIGGKGVIKTDVRIIAATNRNLLKEVEAGRFRSDLFYRLEVFPIHVPPLRERKEDIPLLVSHFIEKLTRKSGKKIKHISAKVMKEMMLYDWPGNIRELEHVVERGILMTTGPTLKEIYLPQTTKETISAEITLKTLEQNERDHIIAALKKSDGRVRGYHGAAELLNIPPTTLHSKIKKLKIKKKHE